MNADAFRDYMLSFLFLHYLSDNYEAAAKRELGSAYPEMLPDVRQKTGMTPLAFWYKQNSEGIEIFEKQLRRKVHYVIDPSYLWGNIAEMARTQNNELLNTLQKCFDHIESESFDRTFRGLFLGINLNSENLGKGYAQRNVNLCVIITKISEGGGEILH